MSFGRRWFSPVDFSAEHALLMRVLELRRSGRIGVVFADAGQYSVAEDSCDPWNTRRRVSVEQLRELVEQLEMPSPFGPGWAGGESDVEARRRIA